MIRGSRLESAKKERSAPHRYQTPAPRYFIASPCIFLGFFTVTLCVGKVIQNGITYRIDDGKCGIYDHRT